MPNDWILTLDLFSWKFRHFREIFTSLGQIFDSLFLIWQIYFGKFIRLLG